jgi:hypothetical protein
MSDVTHDELGQMHRRQAVDANNSVWEILGDASRREVDDLEEMTRRADASAYHRDRAAGAGPAIVEGDLAAVPWFGLPTGA